MSPRSESTLSASPDENDEAVTDGDLERVLELFARTPEARRRWETSRVGLHELVTRHGARQRIHSGRSIAKLERLFRDSALTELGIDCAGYARMVGGIVIRHSVNMASTRSFGHMTSIPPPFMQTIADVVARLNQNLVKADASRVLTLIERQAVTQLHRLAYRREQAFYDAHGEHRDSTLGIVCSGGTLANLTALWLARNACFAPDGVFAGVEEAGLAAALRHFDYNGAVIVGSACMHYSLEKAAAALGLGRAGAIRVGVDGQQRISLSQLEQVIADCHRRRLRIVALVGVAGSTDCGSIDPLPELARIAGRERIHLHVDAAWGGSLLFSTRRRAAIAGIELADSITFDAHKQQFIPVGAGTVLLRDPHAATLIGMSAPYMLHTGSGDLGRFSIEGSRYGAALLMHASMHVFGRRGFAALIERHIDNAQRLAALLAEADDFELLHAPQTNIVLYRYVPEALRASVGQGCLSPAEQQCLNGVNQGIQQRQCEAGNSYVSRTTMRCLERYPGVPIVALRAVLANPLAGVSDMKAMLDEQRALGKG